MALQFKSAEDAAAYAFFRQQVKEEHRRVLDPEEITLSSFEMPDDDSCSICCEGFTLNMAAEGEYFYCMDPEFELLLN